LKMVEVACALSAVVFIFSPCAVHWGTWRRFAHCLLPSVSFCFQLVSNVFTSDFIPFLLISLFWHCPAW
jgi:hypothetical protein